MAKGRMMALEKIWHFDGDNLIDPEGIKAGERKGDSLYFFPPEPKQRTIPEILNILNAHDKLVLGCEAALSEYEPVETGKTFQGFPVTGVRLSLKDVSAQLKAALAAAKGPTNGSESGDCEVN